MVALVPRLGLAEVLRRHGPAYLETHDLSVIKAKAWRAILACRTTVLGGHVETCEACGTTRHVYHSCRNRHCPLCQTRAKEAWLAARQREVLPVPYFHLVFTLPHDSRMDSSGSARERSTRRCSARSRRHSPSSRPTRAGWGGQPRSHWCCIRGSRIWGGTCISMR